MKHKLVICGCALGSLLLIASLYASVGVHRFCHEWSQYGCLGPGRSPEETINLVMNPSTCYMSCTDGAGGGYSWQCVKQ